MTAGGPTAKRAAVKATEEIEHRDGLPFYAQYCFKLSPTVNTYFHLRARDIKSLNTDAGFGGGSLFQTPLAVPHRQCLPCFTGQNVFFHLNHPVHWVRVAGMIVAVDEYPGRRIYTLDDSSGVCVECVVDVPRPNPILNTNAKSESKDAATDTRPEQIVPPEVDVGTVLDVKGGLAVFRGHKQIRILKVAILGSTEQEVAFWERAGQLRRDVLDKPWMLTDREVRRCRKDEERRK